VPGGDRGGDRGEQQWRGGEEGSRVQMLNLLVFAAPVGVRAAVGGGDAAPGGELGSLSNTPGKPGNPG
jgi:hypothetical protein